MSTVKFVQEDEEPAEMSTDEERGGSNYMDTFRESAVLRGKPDTESVAPHVAEGAHSHEAGSRQNASASSASYYNSEAAVYMTTSSAVPDQFSRNYSDPLYPVKDIPYNAVKRFFDILFAIVFLVCTSPIMVVAAILVKTTSKGPIIFKQVRVGRGGRHFWCYKFRSMCVDAEAQKEKLMHLNEASGPVFKIKNDPRVTKVGAVLRKFSIDEFPQVFNVLIGDMSVVGPRPPLPKEVALYSARDRGRLAVRPGLTCTWQVSGRSNVSFDRWMALDLEYIETMSFFNDIKIVLKTIPAVLKGSGAH